MKRGLDLDKAEAALKRAAHRAIHGTREERSGRFFPAEKTDQVPSALAHGSKKSKSKRREG